MVLSVMVIRDECGRFIKGSQFWLGKKGVKKSNSGSFKKGMVPWNLGKKTIKICEQCGCVFSTNKVKMTKPKQRFCSLKCFGINNRGLLYGKKISKMREYKIWRNAVLKRDGYKCVECKSEKDLDAHHIKPKRTFPELSFVVENGMTLCKKCHKKTNSYGSKT